MIKEPHHGTASLFCYSTSLTLDSVNRTTSLYLEVHEFFPVVHVGTPEVNRVLQLGVKCHLPASAGVETIYSASLRVLAIALMPIGVW